MIPTDSSHSQVSAGTANKLKSHQRAQNHAHYLKNFCILSSLV
jgi:hypothetical protein